EAPVHRVDELDHPFYVVSRYDDVFGMLRDHQDWGNAQGPGVEFQEGGVLGSADDPDHRRQRLVLQPAFTPKAIARLRPRIQAIADELFDAFVADGEGDLVTELADPLPTIAIAELLGVPPEDRSRFKAWSDAIVEALGGEGIEHMRVARAELHDYLHELVTVRWELLDAGREPPDDLLTRMTRAGRDDGLLRRSEMVQLAQQLLVAGNETTTSLIGLMVHRLVERPDVLEQVRDDRTLVPATVEEALRFDSPVQGLFRTCPHAAEVLGEDIPAGTKVQLMYAAANRDPDVFERPDEFRLDREPMEVRRTLAFGTGVHYCIGAPLARLEADIALNGILDRMDDLEITGEPELVRPFILRGYSSLPMRWSPR
ncbi:MAG: cytochrome P450, partial [Actinomycetota bacterium]